MKITQGIFFNITAVLERSIPDLYLIIYIFMHHKISFLCNKEFFCIAELKPIPTLAEEWS